MRALIDLTLSNAGRFYSSMGNPLDGKGLNSLHSSIELTLSPMPANEASAAQNEVRLITCT